MKALVLAAYNRFEMQEQPMPEIGPDDVLLKVAACGICGSDVHGMDGRTGRRQPPIGAYQGDPRTVACSAAKDCVDKSLPQHGNP